MKIIVFLSLDTPSPPALGTRQGDAATAAAVGVRDANFLADKDDGLGDIRSILKEEMGKHHAEHVNLMLLEDVERMEPGVAQSAPTPDPALRVEAEREVERIISARGTKDIFGGGSLVQQKSEFRRLVRMLHPDKQLVAGPRATLALRLLVEANGTLVSTR